MSERKILILFFHPRFEDSRTNKALLKAAQSQSNVTVRDVYELYPDYNIDVKAEQEELLKHNVIIWQHPFYWYSCPPMMKQWIDLVLELGWAYGKNGDKLMGKYVLNVLSSGGTFDVYNKTGRNRFTYKELLAPFDQTAYLCNMVYLPSFIVPGANRISDESLDDYCLKYASILNFLQSPQFDLSKLKTINYFNDLNFDSWQEKFYKTH